MLVFRGVHFFFFWVGARGAFQWLNVTSVQEEHVDFGYLLNPWDPCMVYLPAFG